MLRRLTVKNSTEKQNTKLKIQMDKKEKKNMMIKPTKIDNHSIGSHRPVYKYIY